MMISNTEQNNNKRVETVPVHGPTVNHCLKPVDQMPLFHRVTPASTELYSEFSCDTFLSLLKTFKLRHLTVGSCFLVAVRSAAVVDAWFFGANTGDNAGHEQETDVLPLCLGAVNTITLCSPRQVTWPQVYSSSLKNTPQNPLRPPPRPSGGTTVWCGQENTKLPCWLSDTKEEEHKETENVPRWKEQVTETVLRKRWGRESTRGWEGEKRESWWVKQA